MGLCRVRGEPKENKAMNWKGILYSAPMIRAKLDGRKTQTRRIIKAPGWVYRHGDGEPHWMVKEAGSGFEFVEWGSDHARSHPITCPYGKPGDGLYGKETWQSCPTCGFTEYRADANRDNHCRHCDEPLGKWKPSIFMPRSRARILDVITNIRVEQLQDITEEDAKAEGVVWRECEHFEPVELPGRYGPVSGPARIAYKELWESINGPGSWEKNPWVWVIETRNA